MTTATELARALHGVVEPAHAVLYLAEEATAAWAELGLEPRGQGYVACRAAPLGRVGPGGAAAVFYNFNPGLFAHALPSAWDVVTPAQVLDIRARIVETVYTTAGATTDGLEAATATAREVAAAVDVAGRPLAAANRDVDPPGTPFADLWQALTVVREHRGDGHVALLVGEGIDPVEALVLYASWQSVVSRRFLQRTRLWDEATWAAAHGRLAERGLVDDDGLTEDGRRLRDHLEARTDELAAAPWQAVGEGRALALFDVVACHVRALDDAGAFRRPVVLPERP